MKKVLLIGVWSLGFGVSSYANDTLTRAQVYDFSVGDTFDYKHTVDDPNYLLYSVNYQRIIIATKYISANSDTIIYNGTITYTNLDSLEVFTYRQDTLCPPVSYQFDTLPGTGITRNTVGFGCFENAVYYEFARGLGKTYDERSWHTEPLFASVITELIYFSKGSVTWGTPYYILNIPEIRNPQSDFRLSPNPATTTVTISIDGSMVGSTATITDITGRQMAAVQLSTVNRQLSATDFSNGIYFITVTDNKGRSATKKLIIQK